MLGRKKSQETDTKWYPGKYLGKAKKSNESSSTDQPEGGSQQQQQQKEEKDEEDANDGMSCHVMSYLQNMSYHTPFLCSAVQCSAV